MAASPAPVPEPEEDPKGKAYELVASEINKVMANGDFIVAEEAMRLNALMQKDHPIEHLAFLDGEAYHIYYEKIRAAIESARQRARAHQDRSEFGRAAAKRDKREALKIFLVERLEVDDKNTQRTIGEMTGKDHSYVADNYKHSKQRSAMYEQFHRAVAKKVGNKKTSEVMTEEEYTNLLNKITQS